MTEIINCFLCGLLGHRYVKERNLSKECRKIGCTRCSRKWAMNRAIEILIPWDDEFEELYASDGLLGRGAQK